MRANRHTWHGRLSIEAGHTSVQSQSTHTAGNGYIYIVDFQAVIYGGTASTEPSTTPSSSGHNARLVISYRTPPSSRVQRTDISP